MKAKTIDIVNAYALINGAKLSKIEDNKVKFSVIRAMKSLKKPADEYNEFVKDTMAKLRPDGYDEVEAVLNDYKNRSEEEVRKALEAQAAYSKEIEECVKPEADKEVEVAITAMNDEQLGQLIGSNDWTVGQAGLVCDIIGE